jgi:hypothetical protein
MSTEFLVFSLLICAPILVYWLGAINLISSRARDIAVGTLLLVLALVFFAAWVIFFLESGVLPGNAKHGPLAVDASDPIFIRLLYGALWLFITWKTFTVGYSMVRAATRRRS